MGDAGGAVGILHYEKLKSQQTVVLCLGLLYFSTDHNVIYSFYSRLRRFLQMLAVPTKHKTVYIANTTA